MAIALPSFKKDLSSQQITRISAIIFIYSGALSLNAFYIQSIGSGIGIYSGLFHVTIISQFLDMLLLFLAALILMSWPLITSAYYNKVLDLQTLLTGDNITSLNTRTKKFNCVGLYTPRTEYCLIVLFSALGSTLLISSSDLLSMYISLELQSFGLYILATLYRDYSSATAAGLKYFLLGALSSCLILLGAGVIYSFTGLTNFESIYSLISVSIPSIDSINFMYSIPSSIFVDGIAHKIISGVSLGIIFIFIGLLFKIGAAPFHSWSPDVYDESPTQVTIWLTIIPKIAILTLLLELTNGFSIISVLNSPLFLYADNLINNTFNVTYNISYVIKMLLLISSLFSLLIGTIVGLSQIRIKRLLAYSTISHIGFILLALAINTEQSINALIFYIIQYSITNLNVFLIILASGYIMHNKGIKLYSNSESVFFFDFDIRYLNNFKGLSFWNPILSLSFAICLLSMAGIPPLLGFFSKQFVLLSAIESGYWFISFVAIATSVISASYYLRVLIILITPISITLPDSSSSSSSSSSSTSTSIIVTDSSSQFYNSNNSNNSNKNISILTNLHSFIISTLTLSILLFILKPTILLNSTQLLSLSLFYS